MIVCVFIAYLYHEFNHPADFEAAVKHAQDLDVLLWSNPKKRSMVITQSYVQRQRINDHACPNERIYSLYYRGHDSVKGFVKRRLQSKSQ